MGVDLVEIGLLGVDLVGVDLVGVDFMRVDLVGLTQEGNCSKALAVAGP